MTGLLSHEIVRRLPALTPRDRATDPVAHTRHATTRGRWEWRPRLPWIGKLRAYAKLSVKCERLQEDYYLTAYCPSQRVAYGLIVSLDKGLEQRMGFVRFADLEMAMELGVSVEYDPTFTPWALARCP